ncbi:hypothetical protein B0H67DRAFT_567641 [Lasiosphaeris hirsuta]|uniref:Uncharacterized protein n=1 Tax=Lasiosphaeris hirsuta TaxID=260670 RepID=A0AA40E1D4_9PEZI|nr:hypothetical protein B0H67DRAFT_567641 [Lasiosphaeris hirsuta]
MVQLLLDTGEVDIEAKDAIYGWTPLSWAVKNGHRHTAVVKLLRDRAKPVGTSQLH